ncbi:circadian-associated transcriptional repressor [Podarcis raffonei]|uniref:circadian-associated transcriptional repressor n=1 Tax=Podarcis raffonei TaxID=65483 RepID=UPI0023298A5E|nr:circadian-associated transcriptional repressor [Podarcis raffonei]
MAAMDSSSKSVSSGESMYSVESATSEDDDDRSADFDVFSDGGSDAEKESGPLKHRRGAYPGRQPFLFSPEPLGRTSPSLPCRERNRRTRKPLGLLAAARLRPTGPCCRHPPALDEAYYSRLADTGGGLRRNPAGRRRAESGRCQNGGVQPHPYAAQPPLRGVKRQRNHVADREDVRSPCWTERDHIFAQKCLELQGFIHPLVELLNRLKMGRFDRGLSSFQQSVAMDRIQRIIGVLQKPEMGERYLGTLLQVERMLKLWFPHIAVRNACADCGVAATQDSCDTAEQSSMEENLPETRLPSGQGPTQSPPTEELHQTHLGDLVSPGDKTTAPLGESPRFLGGDWPAMNLTWIHTSPISTPPLGNADVGRASSVFGQTLLAPNCTAYGLVVFLQNNPYGRPTSSTPAHLSMSCRHTDRLRPGPGEPPRCQSLPGATAVGSCLGQGPHSGFSRSLPHLPTSGEGHMVTSDGRPAYHCDS